MGRERGERLKPMRSPALVCAQAMSRAPAASLRADLVALYAAGSRKAALGELAADDQAAHGLPVETTFAPSGLFRERIEQGAPAHVFASAVPKQPLAQARGGRGGPAALFARLMIRAAAAVVPAE